MSAVLNPSPRAAARAVTVSDAELCERAIFSAKPIDTWPAEALRRLAAASRVRRYRRGARLVSGGETLQAALLIAAVMSRSASAAPTAGSSPMRWARVVRSSACCRCSTAAACRTT